MYTIIMRMRTGTTIKATINDDVGVDGDGDEDDGDDDDDHAGDDWK